MKKGILGTKVGMTQIWTDQGERLSVTVVKAGPCSVVQVKSTEKEGYQAVQIACNPSSEKHLSKAEKGHQKAVNEKSGVYFRDLVELRDYPEEAAVGDQIKCDSFKAGEKICVSGIAKGKGFQGVVKRYNFHGGRKTHGSHFHRAPGAIGAGTDPGRVNKGKKMPGRTGGKKVTTKNLEIARVVPEENLVLIKGAVPGVKGASLFLYVN